MMNVVTKKLEAKLAGVWVDLTEDLVGAISLSWGNRNKGVLDRMAQSGTLRWRLNNSAENSQGVVGCYSPRSANKRAGWQKDVEIRFSLVVDGVVERVFHRGWLRAITVAPGEEGVHPVECTSRDWLDQAARHEVRGVGTLIDATIDEAVDELLAEIPIPPFATNLDPGTDVHPFLLDDLRGGSYLAALTRLVFSEIGYGYLLRDGTLRVEARTRRFLAAEPGVTIDEPFNVETEEADVANLARVVITPRVKDLDVVTLATSKKAIEIAPGDSFTFELKYVDPLQEASRIGGVEMVNPVAITDYLFNSAANGTGVDLTASLGVAVVFGGDVVRVTVTNNHASSKGFVTKFEVRGKGLYTYQPQTYELRNQALIDATGERELELQMPYQSDPNVARSAAAALLAAGAEGDQGASVTFAAESDDHHMDALLNYDIGSLVAAEEPVSAVTGPAWIHGIELQFQEPGISWVTWHLLKADTNRYWQMGVVGLSELGVTTFIGPY